MELIFLILGVLLGALGCWLAMRARFFEPLRRETERRAHAEAIAQRVPELETRLAELQTANTSLAAERRVFAEAQTKMLELSVPFLPKRCRPNQMFLDLADTALAKRQMAIDELVRPLKESLGKSIRRCRSWKQRVCPRTRRRPRNCNPSVQKRQTL